MKVWKKATALFLIAVLSGCGGGSSDSDSSDSGSNDSSVSDGGSSGGDDSGTGDSDSDSGSDANASPVIASFSTAVSESNPLQVTFTWSVSDSDSDSVSCVLTPGSDMEAVAIEDCVNSTSTAVTYSGTGSHSATLAALDSHGASDSRSTSVSVTAPVENDVSSTVTLSGSVTTFSDSSDIEAQSIVRRVDVPVNQYKHVSVALGSDAAAVVATDNGERAGLGDSVAYATVGTSTASTITSDDMVPSSALVSLFLLSDVRYENPVATVRTDASGNYEVTTADVKTYLLSQNLITTSSTEEEIIAAFRSLGKLQVRALLVKEKDGTQKALAIQTIADPAQVDETTGLPAPVSVNPIAHRITKSIVSQVKESIASLRDMGVSDELVAELTNTVITSVAAQIDRVLEDAAGGEIEIPEGQSLADVIASQESEFELNIPEQQLGSLTNVISGTTDVDEEVVNTLKDGVLNADEVIDDEDSTLKSSLDSESQGLLSGLQAALNENVADGVNEVIEEAQSAGTLDQVFVVAEGQTTEEALAASLTQQNRLLRRTLQRFFLSMGLAVMVDENDLGNAGVVAINVPSPFHIGNALLPGGRGFGDREIRLFKLGEGDLDVDSDYTSDPGALLGQLDENGVPQAPFYYAPPLEEVVDRLLGGQSLEDFQAALDAAFMQVNNPGSTPDQADFELLDRVRIFHELSDRLRHANLVSRQVIDKLIAYKSSSIRIKRLAAVLAQNFTWVKESVNLTPEGFPIFTGRLAPLAGGASIDSSELIRAMSLTLGESAKETARLLTQKRSFYAQFASDAVQSSIQRARFQQEPNFDLLQALLDTYPETADGYRDLILGTASGIPTTPAYAFARDRVARGLTSAVPSTLFGQTLTSESSINVRSALFMVDFLLKSKFLIDTDQGYFTAFTIIDGQGAQHSRQIPNFDNLKVMAPGTSVSVATLVSSLLNITEIANGEFFQSVRVSVADGLSGLPQLPEFKQQNIDEFVDTLDNRSDVVDISCTVERFDGSDPGAGDSTDQLMLKVFAVQYNDADGSFFKGDSIDATVNSQLLEGAGPARRTYTIEDLPVLDGAEYGRDYVIRFSIPSYQNDLPELFFYADGFAPQMNLCDPQTPMMIGPDQQFEPVPGLGLVSDQSRPGIAGQPPQPEGIDISNFEQPGAPIYLTTQEEAAGLGAVDFFFSATDTGYAIEAAGGDNLGFAPLFGGYSDGVLTLSLSPDGGLEPVYGIASIMGANIRSLIESVAVDSGALSASVEVDTENFVHDRLYLMRDRGSKYWILELRVLDQFIEPDGAEVAFIDVGIASVDSLGRVAIPKAAFDALPVNDDGGPAGMTHYRLLYGDWLILDNPSQYSGPDLLPPQEVSFGGNDIEYAQLATATDGVFFRYAGEHFEENISGHEDFDTVFGNPPDYSSIPVRIDAGRTGIRFVKLSFNKQDRTYVMEPSPENATAFVINLKHNNIIAVFDDNDGEGATPTFLGRVIRDIPSDDPYANFEIGLDMVRFDPASADHGAEANVVCFTEEAMVCPAEHPTLVFSSALDTAIGTIYDADFDGVPTLFDPNDSDPNVPGQASAGGGTDAGATGTGFGEGLFISLMAEADGAGGVEKSFLVETENVYPGDIQAVVLESEIFGADAGQQVIFTCTPPAVDSDTGEFTDFQCSSLSVDGGVSVALASKFGDGVGFNLSVPEETFVGLGNRVDFAYKISYRAPTDIEGNPFMCGAEPCPARPTTEGSVSVRIPAELAVLEDLTLAVGTGDPQSFSGVTSLDVTRDLTFTGAKIPGAVEYEMNVYCSGSEPGEAFVPEENMFFFAPARDGSGRAIQPEFLLNTPWIGGRTCDFRLTAFLENDAGDFIGVSVLSFDDVTTSGGAGFNQGFFVDNEIKLAVGDSICLNTAEDGFTAPSITDCTEDNTLFTLEAIVTGEDGSSTEASTTEVSITTEDSATDSSTARIVFGSGVSEAFADGGRKELTYGQLAAGSLVVFNVDLGAGEGGIVPPTCGAISTDIYSNFCTEQDRVDVMTDFFAVNAEFTELSLLDSLPMELEIQGPTTETGAIPLDQQGFFVVVEPQSGEEILEVVIDSFTLEGDAREVWARFTLTASGNEYSGDGDNSFELTAPGFMYVLHSNGQAVDFDLRFIRADLMKLAWFLPPPRQTLAGEHDVDGDGVTDVTASYDSGAWTFSFSSELAGVNHFTAVGSEELSAGEGGDYTIVIAESEHRAEFGLRFSDIQFNFIAEFNEGGTGHAEWFDIFGGGDFTNTGDLGDCFECPQVEYDSPANPDPHGSAGTGGGIDGQG